MWRDHEPIINDLRLMNQKSLLLACAAGTSLMTVSHAATFFSDPLTTNTNFTTHGSAVTFGPTGAVFSGADDSARTYISTNLSPHGAYGATAFVATVDFTYSPTSAGAFYFGIGTGDVAGGGPGGFYNSPDVNLPGHSGAWIAWDPRDEGSVSGKFESKAMTDGASANLFADNENPFTTTVPFGNGTASRTTMTWNPATNQITWTLDIGQDGSIEETHSATLSQAVVDRWNINGDPSAIYFGGNQGITATNFSVVPEPGTAALLGLSMLALLKRRRR